MKKINYIIIFLAVLSLSSVAQNILSGKVKAADGGAALPGVTIYIPDLKLGAVSKEDGTYTINNVPNGTFLVQVTSIGYASLAQEVNIKESPTADFELHVSSMEIKEVVVTGVSSATEAKSNPVPVDVVTHSELIENSSS